MSKGVKEGQRKSFGSYNFISNDGMQMGLMRQMFTDLICVDLVNLLHQRSVFSQLKIGRCISIDDPELLQKSK